MRIVLAIVATLLLMALGFLGYAGYFGGRLFTPIAATGHAPRAERGIAAVFLSGDVGFDAGMDPGIAARLSAHGIPVLGVNSLVYFRDRRSTAEARDLLVHAMERALAFPGVDRVVLIGQSFGADMLHVALPSLPPALRRKVLLVSLIVPGDTVIFKASPAEALDLLAPDTKAWPTARQLDWTPVLCVQGAQETDSLCPLMTMPNVRRVALPGGHRLKFDTQRVYAEIAGAIRMVTRVSSVRARLPNIQLPLRSVP